MGVVIRESVEESNQKEALKQIENFIETVIFVGAQTRIALKEFTMRNFQSYLEFDRFTKSITADRGEKRDADILQLLYEITFYLNS